MLLYLSPQALGVKYSSDSEQMKAAVKIMTETIKEVRAKVSKMS